MTSLIDEYRRFAAAHSACTIEGDADGINAAHDQVQRTVRSLVSQGKGDQLFQLYDDIDPSVQCWAAAHTLEIDETRALAKLEQLEKAGIPHISTDAKYTSQEWKSGALRFLPS